MRQHRGWEFEVVRIVETSPTLFDLSLCPSLCACSQGSSAILHASVFTAGMHIATYFMHRVCFDVEKSATLSRFRTTNRTESIRCVASRRRFSYPVRPS